MYTDEMFQLHKRLPSLDATTGRLYTTVQQQLWDLLPAFLESPSDFSASYPTLAPILGAAIQERKDLRMVRMNSCIWLHDYKSSQH